MTPAEGSFDITMRSFATLRMTPLAFEDDACCVQDDSLYAQDDTR